MSGLLSSSTADVSLSLGGRWHAAEQREREQAQVIAHLTNQLEGMQSAYRRDAEQVAASKVLVDRMEQELQAASNERDEWRDAYNGVAEQRLERDRMVDHLMTQLRTLEDTTRSEEVRAENESRRAELLSAEKSVAHEKLARLEAELAETHRRLARTADALASERDTTAGLTATIQSLTHWRHAKEAQVATLIKDKQSLFQLVTELRASLRDAKAGGNVLQLDRDIAAAAAAIEHSKLVDAPACPASRTGSPRKPSASSSSSTAVSAPSTAASRRSSLVAGSPFAVQALLAGTQNRRPFSALTRRASASDAGAITSAAQLDALTAASGSANLARTGGGSSSSRSRRASVSNIAGNGFSARSRSSSQAPSGRNSTVTSPRGDRSRASAAAASQAGASTEAVSLPASPRRSPRGDMQSAGQVPHSARSGGTPRLERRRRLAGTVSSEEEEAEEAEQEAKKGHTHAATAATALARRASSLHRRGSQAADTLLQRLQRQISLLEEKLKEQDKCLSMLRGDNAELVSRFRGAHTGRAQAEKRLKSLEAELLTVRGQVGAQQLQRDATNGQHGAAGHSSISKSNPTSARIHSDILPNAFDELQPQPFQLQYEERVLVSPPPSAQKAAQQAAEAARWK